MTLKRMSLVCSLTLSSICLPYLQANESASQESYTSHTPIPTMKKYIPSNPVYLGKRDIDYSQEHPILGISSIRYDESGSGSYWLQSDDTGYSRNLFGQRGISRLYQVPEQHIWNKADERPYSALNTKPFIQYYRNTIKPVILEPTPSIANSHCGQIDTESFDFMDNGDLFIASEQNPGWGFCWSEALPTLVIPPLSLTASYFYYVQSYFLKATKNGTINGIYYLPQELINEGIKVNKGIESVARFPGSDNYVAIFEGPLQKDSDAWEAQIERVTCKDTTDEASRKACIDLAKASTSAPRRVLFFSMSELKDQVSGEIEPVQFDYIPNEVSLTDSELAGIKPGFPKKRITDAHAVNDSQFLVLETTYVELKPILTKGSKEYEDAHRYLTAKELSEMTSSKYYSYAQVFLLERPKAVIDSASGIKGHVPPEHRLEKRQVLNTQLFSHKDSLNTQNFEGITLGPTLKDGSRVLVLVNDNDALSAKPENTTLSFFKINGKLFHTDKE